MKPLKLTGVGALWRAWACCLGVCLVLMLPIVAASGHHAGWQDARPGRELLATASSQLCSSQEFYCTDASVYMDTAFTQAASGNCTADDGACSPHGGRPSPPTLVPASLRSPPAAELGVVFCGGLVIPVASYKALQQDYSACVADCTQGSNALALPLQYYWNASAWQPCPVTCDGGFQTRDVACVNSVDNRYRRTVLLRRLRQGLSVLQAWQVHRTLRTGCCSEHRIPLHTMQESYTSLCTAWRARTCARQRPSLRPASPAA